MDPFLDEEVLRKFCVYAKGRVTLRLLGKRYMSTLAPAAEALKKERGAVELRASEDIHDRFIFVDGSKCFLSGASFKDGPTNAVSVLTEIIDGASSLQAMYE